MARVSVSHMLNALVDLGRTYLDRPAAGGGIDALVAQCHDLVSANGEASGTALWTKRSPPTRRRWRRRRAPMPTRRTMRATGNLQAP